jgi:hypothetical protein
MTAVNATNLSLLDIVKRTDPNGAIAAIVEQLTARNAALKDAVWKEGNLTTGERVSSRTGLPGIAWRRFNEGVTAGKSRVDQYDETCGMLDGLSEVDVELAKLGGNEAAFRASEDNAFLQSFNNEVETGLFYHSTKTAPEKFMGLAPRFGSTSQFGGSQIIPFDSTAAGNDTTSMWLVKWGDDSVHFITPKGYPTGLQHKDMGEQIVLDANSKKYRAYVTSWTWKVGLCVRDYRNVVRIANIDTGNGVLAKTGSLLIQAMVQAYHQIFQPGAGKLAFYCNRTIATYLHLQALDSTKNSTLTVERIGGEPVTMFLGIPVRETDAILNTETALS